MYSGGRSTSCGRSGAAVDAMDFGIGHQSQAMKIASTRKIEPFEPKRTAQENINVRVNNIITFICTEYKQNQCNVPIQLPVHVPIYMLYINTVPYCTVLYRTLPPPVPYRTVTYRTVPPVPYRTVPCTESYPYPILMTKTIVFITILL